MQDKYLGTFLVDNVYDLQSMMSTYPGDVWQLAEEQLLEPIALRRGPRDHRSGGHEPSRRHHRGHGPAVGARRLPARPPLHVPQPGDRTLRLLDGRLSRVQPGVAAARADCEGRRRHRRDAGPRRVFPALGGRLQERLHQRSEGRRRAGRSAAEFLNYPGLNDLVYPYHTTPGYWYLYEIAFGSHPKGFRHPLQLQRSGSTIGERSAAVSFTGAWVSVCGTIPMRRPSPRSGPSSPQSTTCRVITAGTPTPTSRPTSSSCATPTSGRPCSTRGG